MFNRRAILVLSVLCLSHLAAAQTKGTYINFGKGCQGTGALGCPTNNPNGGQLLGNHNANTFALEVVAGGAMVVTGFELYTSGNNQNLTIPTQIYLANASNSAPLNSPAVTGSMSIGASPGWYKTSFTQKLVMKTGQKFFLSYTPSRSMKFPFVNLGNRSPAFFKTPSSLAWSLAPAAPWAWKVTCTRSGAVPTLMNRGVPTINNSFSVNLVFAKKNTGAALILGGSKTKWGPFTLPLDLTGAGARGCSLLVSFDLIFPTVVDAFGRASINLSIPNARFLIGLEFHNQFFVVDSGANNLGLAFSNGGTGKIGG